jgi:hypothetical protein
VENTLRNASETEAAVTVFKSCFWNAVHKECCFSVKETKCHPDLEGSSLPTSAWIQSCSDLEDKWLYEQQRKTILIQTSAFLHLQVCFLNRDMDQEEEGAGGVAQAWGPEFKPQY